MCAWERTTAFSPPAASCCGVKRKVRVDVDGLLAAALEEAAVQQHVLARAFDVVARPGDGLVRTPEMQTNCHAFSYACVARWQIASPAPFVSQEDNDSGAIEIKLDRPCKSLCVNLTHVQKTRRNGVPGKATRGIRLYVSPWNLRATVIYFRLHTNPFNNSSIVLDMKILALDGQPVVSQYCSDSLTQ